MFGKPCKMGLPFLCACKMLAEFDKNGLTTNKGLFLIRNIKFINYNGVAKDFWNGRREKISLLDV